MIKLCSSVKEVHFFTVAFLSGVVTKLEKNSCPGKNGLSGEYAIYAHGNLCLLFTDLFNSMLVHNYVPGDLIDTVVVPLFKSKHGDLCSTDSYRPISLASVMSKIPESVTVILAKHKD